MNRIKLILITILVVVVAISCATTSGTGATSGTDTAKAGADAGPVLSASPVYYATGTASSQSAAFNDAKMNAVKKAASDALGIASSAANRDKLESKIYITSNANAYVYNETMEILDRGDDNGSSTVSIGIRVNLEAISNILRANEIYGNIILPQGGEVLLADMERPSFAPAPVVSEEKASENATSPVLEKPEPSPEATPEEIALIDEIIGNLTFMVYYDEESATDPFLAKTAVGMANRYLSENGMEYVDLGQIEQIKKDQAAAYEDPHKLLPDLS